MIGMGILIDDHILSDSHSSQIPPSYQSGAELNRKVGAFINIYNSNFTWVYVRYTYTFHSGWWLYTNGPGHFRNLNRRYLPYIRPILYKAYVREYPHKNMARNMVQYLYFRILKFPLIINQQTSLGGHHLDLKNIFARNLVSDFGSARRPPSQVLVGISWEEIWKISIFFNMNGVFMEVYSC